MQLQPEGLISSGWTSKSSYQVYFARGLKNVFLVVVVFCGGIPDFFNVVTYFFRTFTKL